MGPHEPYWRTNTSYSPPPSRWDFSFQPESLSFRSNDGVQLYGSSASSNSRDSRGWMRGNNYHSSHQLLVSDGIGLYLSSLDVSPARQWTPPAVQEISMDDYGNSSRDVVSRPLYFSPNIEGTSEARNSEGSISSRSDTSIDHEAAASSHPNPTRRRFLPKPVHPLAFTAAAAAGPSGSTSDYRSSRCRLCRRFLSQRPPCGSRRIVRGGDPPVTGVLACCHVFHADCLDRAATGPRMHDPTCPICSSDPTSGRRPPEESGGSHENRRRSSKPWVCGRAGDCVPGARSNTSSNSSGALLSLKFKKSVSMKGNSSNGGSSVAGEFPGKARRTGGPFMQWACMGPVEQAGPSRSKVCE